MHPAANWKKKFVLFLLIGSPYFQTPAITYGDDFPPTICEEIDGNREIAGTVSDESGNPILGAQVYSIRNAHYIISRQKSYFDFGEPAKTDSDGKYLLRSNSANDTHHLIIAPGYAPCVIAIPDQGEVEATLDKGRTVSGTFYGPDEQPLVNASVRMVQWYIQKPVDQQSNNEFDTIGANNNFSATLPDQGKSTSVKTQPDGSFEIPNLPAEHRVALIVEANGIQTNLLFIRGIEDGNEDSRAPDFNDQILLSNNFEHTLKPCSVLRLRGFDSGETAVEIERVTLQPISKSSNPETSRITREVGKQSAEINLPSYPNGFVAFIEPKDNLTFTGRRVEFLTTDGSETIEHDVHFNKGITVRGVVVDALTEQGVAGAQLRWRSTNSTEFDNDDNLAPLIYETNEGGVFEFAVPDYDATLGIVGNVNGYQGVSGWYSNVPGAAEEFQCIARYIRSLKAGEIESLPPFRFELLPSYELNITTLLPSGNPASNCKVIGASLQLEAFSNAYRTKETIKKSDLNGRCLFENWYPDAVLVEKAIQQSKSQNSHHRKIGYPTVLIASTDSGDHGSVTAPLPDPEDESYEIDIEIQLREPGNVKGQVLGTDGQPVVDLEVKATTSSFFGANSGHIWKTKTRDDGRFLMAGIPVDVNLKWSLDYTRVKLNNWQFDLDLSELRSNSTVEIPPITALDLTELSKPIPEFANSTADNDTALKELTLFAAQQVAKIPVFNKENGKFLSSRTRGDSIDRFSKKLEAALIPLVEDLADRDPGGPYEIKVLAMASSWFDPKKKDPFSMRFAEGSRIKSFCHNRMVENQIENKDAQMVIIEMTENMVGFGGSSFWEKLESQSPFTQTQAIAACNIARESAWELKYSCKSQFPLRDFQNEFNTFQNRLRSALKTNRKMIDDRTVGGLKSQLGAIRKNTAQEMKEPSTFNGKRQDWDPTRLQMMIDLIDEYVEPSNDTD